MKKAILSLSGGMDSTTVLGFLLKEGYEVDCVSFNYGSKHNPFESKAVEKVAKHYGVLLHHIDLTGVSSFLDSHLLKAGGEIPEGHYTAPSMSQTVVPGRNIIFLSVLSGIAWSRSCSKVALGIHQGDHAIYPDCRQDFFKAIDLAIYLGTDKRVELIAPFLSTDKTGIAKWGMENAVPYQLTRTCYKDQEVACGKCGACTERLEAFALNNSVDPIPYEKN